MAYKVARTRLFGCWMLNVGLLYPHITLCLFTAAEWVFLVFLFHFFSPPPFLANGSLLFLAFLQHGQHNNVAANEKLQVDT